MRSVAAHPMHLGNLEVIAPPAHGGGVELLLYGELDVSTCPDLLAAVGEALNSAPVPGATLALDLSALDFIDSTGLGALVTANHLCEQRGWRLVLRRPRPSARRLLSITGVGDRLTVHDL